MRIENLEAYVKSLPNSEERIKKLVLFQSLPYQVINDSPTVKHYTDWAKFEEADLTVRPGELSGDVKLTELQDTDSGIPHDNRLVPLIEATAVKGLAEVSGEKRLVFSSRGKAFSPLNLRLEVKDDARLTLHFKASEGSAIGFLLDFVVPRSVKARVELIVEPDVTSLVYGRYRARNEGALELSVVTTAGRAGRVQGDVRLAEESVNTFLVRSLGYEGSMDNVINVIHEGPRSVSDGVLKAVSFNSALISIRGVASISEYAYDSSTSIIGRSFIQGSNAKAVVTPMLEVKTGRVRTAKHSASAMKVPEDLLFYLESRGFDKKEANALIVRGFMEDERDSEEVKRVISSVLDKVL